MFSNHLNLTIAKQVSLITGSTSLGNTLIKALWTCHDYNSFIPSSLDSKDNYSLTPADNVTFATMVSDTKFSFLSTISSLVITSLPDVSYGCYAFLIVTPTYLVALLLFTSLACNMKTNSSRYAIKSIQL